MAAKYDLARVQQAAREERIELDERRARDEVSRHLATWLDAYPFAADVLLGLAATDYCETVTLGPPHGGAYDVYGVRISEAVAVRHGVRPRSWYLKFRMYEALSGETVFFVSLHPLEFDMPRLGGWLRTN